MEEDDQVPGVHVEELLLRRFRHGELTLDGIKVEARRLQLRKETERRLLQRCVATLYGIDDIDAAA